MNASNESMHAAHGEPVDGSAGNYVPPAQAPVVSAPPRGNLWQRPGSMPFDPRRKSPLLAAFLSICPGLGQVYVGYYQRGFVHILVMASVFAAAVNSLFPGAEPFLVLFIIFFELYNIVDAGRRAALYNYAMESGETPEIPAGQTELPGLGGSLVGGALLILVGGILLSHTVFEIPLDWLERWWPVAPILFGVYLLARWQQERSTGVDRPRRDGQQR